MNDQVLGLAVAAALPTFVFGLVGFLLKRSIADMDRALERLVGKVDGLHQLGSTRDIAAARAEANFEALERRVTELERK